MDAVYSTLTVMHEAAFLLSDYLVPPGLWPVGDQTTHNFNLFFLFRLVILLYKIHVYIASLGHLAFLS